MRALGRGKPEIHHSDQRVQYAATAYHIKMCEICPFAMGGQNWAMVGPSYGLLARTVPLLRPAQEPNRSMIECPAYTA
jgi:hypothetical protein